MKLLLLIVALLGLWLIAARWSTPPTPAAFTYADRSDISTLDVPRVSWNHDFRVLGALFEPLLRVDTLTPGGPVVPGVAQSWESTPDKLTWTFHLRGDARWSTGDAVRAGDFVHAWRRALLPEVGGDYTSMLRLIKGAGKFYRWRAGALERFARAGEGAARPDEAAALWEETKKQFDALVGVRAIDDRTLVVTLERRCAYILDVLAFDALAPTFPPLIDRFTTIDPVTARLRFDSRWTKPPNMVGNGPYRLESWQFRRELRLVKNPHYWNARAVALESIAVRSIPDPNAAVLAFKTGTIDWLSEVVPDYAADMLESKRAFCAQHAGAVRAMRERGLDELSIDRALPPDPRSTIHALPAFGTYFYSFNCSPRLSDGRVNPLADARVRRALALTIDKQHIVENIRRRGERVAGSLVPPGVIAGYTPPAGLGFDPERARALLVDAGYPGGAGLPTIELLVNADGGHAGIAQSVQRDWQKHLGVRVQIQQRETKVFRANLKSRDYMVARGSWFGDYADPTTFLDLSRHDDGNNDRGYDDPAYDARLDAAADEPDPAARLDMLAQAERQLMEDQVPMVPLFHYTNLYLFDAHTLTGVSPLPRQKHALDRFRLEPPARPTP